MIMLPDSGATHFTKFVPKTAGFEGWLFEQLQAYKYKVLTTGVQSKRSYLCTNTFLSRNENSASDWNSVVYNLSVMASRRRDDGGGRDTRLSKTLSWLCRHGAPKEGVTVHAGTVRKLRIRFSMKGNVWCPVGVTWSHSHYHTINAYVLVQTCRSTLCTRCAHECIVTMPCTDTLYTLMWRLADTDSFIYSMSEQVLSPSQFPFQHLNVLEFSRN